MRSLLAAVAMMFVTGLAWAQEVMSPADFREVYVQRVTAAVPGAAVTRLEGLALRITPPTGDSGAMTVNLERAYSEYAAVPDQLDTILGRWVRLASTPPSDAQQPERIVSVVRTAEHVTGYTRALSQQNGEEVRLIRRPLAGDLVEMIAFDSAEAIQFGTEDSLSDLGLNAEQAWALAPQNLPTRLGTLQQETLAPGITWVGGGNGLAPSVLTNAGWCNAPENANALYLIVDRDAFLMAERPTGVDAIRRVRDGMMSDGSAFSGTLLACEGGRLQAHN